MRLLKNLILASGASIVAFSAAQAADLPVKAKAVEYVRVCTLYGEGFYYIPGTDTCLKIGGAVRLDTTFNGSVFDTPYFSTAGGLKTRAADYTLSRARVLFVVDSRTATDYGVVRTYTNMKMQWTDSVDTIAGGFFETDFVFLQFAGFTFGKAVSMFDTQWVLTQPTISSGIIGGSDNKTGILQASYTAEFGNGYSGTISLEDPRPYRRGGVVNINNPMNIPGTTAATNSETGIRMPEIVGNLRLDQAWGSLHLGAAIHEVAMTYNGVTENTGHYDSKYGFAVTGGAQFKQLPTGASDTLGIDFTYARGASTYVFGNTQNTNRSGYGMFGGSGMFGTYQSVAFGQYNDAYFGSPGGPAVTDLQLATDIGARIYFDHGWTPQWRTSLFGSWAYHQNTDTANNLMLAKLNAGGAMGVGSTAALSGNFNFSIWQIGSRTAWTPVRDLTFTAEVIYTRLNTSLSGTITPASGYFANKPGAIYDLKDQGTVSGAVQVLRSF